MNLKKMDTQKGAGFFLLVIFIMGMQVNIGLSDQQTAASVGEHIIPLNKIHSELWIEKRNIENTSLDYQKSILDRLINSYLMSEKVKEEGLDKDPIIKGAIENAISNVLMQAYIRKIETAIEQPTQDEIIAYYEKKPYIFALRKIYRMNEIDILGSKEQLESVEAYYSKISSLEDMIKFLKSQNIEHKAKVVTNAAEDWPPHILKSIVKLNKRQVLKINHDQGMSILQLIAVKKAPKTLNQARVAISNYLFREKVSKKVDQMLEKLKSGVDIKYYPPFANKP